MKPNELKEAKESLYAAMRADIMQKLQEAHPLHVFGSLLLNVAGTQPDKIAPDTMHVGFSEPLKIIFIYFPADEDIFNTMLQLAIDYFRDSGVHVDVGTVAFLPELNGTTPIILQPTLTIIQ